MKIAHRNMRAGLPVDEEIRQRLLSRVSKDGPASWAGQPCWIWTRGKLSNGYAVVSYQGKNRLAHRLAYTIFRRPIPDGLQIDHLCGNRACVNPDHLEPVTARANTLRSEAPSAANALATHCKRGHEFTAENTYVSVAGGRVCRTCSAAWRRAKRAGIHVDAAVAGDFRQRMIKRNVRRPSAVDVRRRMEALTDE